MRGRRLQLVVLAALAHLSVVMATVSVGLEHVHDAVSCLTAKRRCLGDAPCRRRLDAVHDVCGNNSQ